MKNIFLLCLILPFISFSQKPTDKRLQGLDTFVAHVLRDWHAPGVSIAVIEKNKIVYTGGFGYRDMDRKLPVTENTLYAIGSCTKAFTAAMIGMLQQEGKLDIDKPVRDYLPELRFRDEYANAHVTLRDMLSHRTGLPRHDLSWYGSDASRQELLKRIQYLEPTAELRQKYQYNNFMFMSAGLVIEKLTGKSWEQNVKERILEPLNMNLSNVSMKDMEAASDHSLAYALKNDSVISLIPYRNIDALAPAGAINSSAKDMASWLITWVNGGRFNGKQIIPASFVNEAITLQMATGGGLPDRENPDLNFSGYGLGWGMSSYRGHYRVAHSGGIDGFISNTCFFPSDSIGIFVVSNQNGPVSVIRNFISDRMLHLSGRNWNYNLLNADRKAKAAVAAAREKKDSSLKRSAPLHPLADYVGEYLNPGYGTVKMKLEKDTLFAEFNSFRLPLNHSQYDHFSGVQDGNSLEFGFHTNAKGEVDMVSAPLETGVKEIEFKKEIRGIEVEKNALLKYAGEYELAGQNIVFSVRGNTLYCLVPNQPEYELVPVKKDEFNLKVVSGYSVRFESNEKGEVISATFVQPNGNFKAVKKK